MVRISVLLLFVGFLSEGVLGGPLLISEVLYDAEGSDQGRTFVELTGPGGLSLGGYMLQGLNGVGGTVTHTQFLDGLSIPADGFLVLADLDSSGITGVFNADAGFPDLDFQNGPDSIRLMLGGAVVDALGYGSFGGSLVFAGEGMPAADAPAGSSLARRLTGVDTQWNASDFFVDGSPSPGFENVSGVAVPTPEPSSLLLMSFGVLAVYGYAKRYRSKQ